MGGRLAKPNPRINHDPLSGNAALLHGVDAFRQVGGDFRQHVVIVGILLHRRGRALHVHANDAGPGSRETEAIAGSKVRPDTSLTITAPASSARRATSAFLVSIANGTVRGWQCVDHRKDPPQFLIDGNGTRSRPGRFPTDIEQVGPHGNKLSSMLDSKAMVKILAAIGEAVRRDIHDSHDFWEIAQLPRGSRKAPGQESRGSI